ncbi:hypothetical protein [Pyxidicoccus caerfyrddinensis]|nr:hypothetical protein [Pyxidicoccus caerfyrddinensis]
MERSAPKAHLHAIAFQDWERDELITWCDADYGKRVAQGLGR